MNLILWALTLYILLAAAAVLPLFHWRRSWLRWLVVLQIVLSGAAIAISILSTGHPRPSWALIGAERSGTVLGFLPVPNEAIYLWIQPATGGPPVSLVMPWEQQKAAEGQTQWQQREQRGLPMFTADGGVRPARPPEQQSKD